MLLVCLLSLMPHVPSANKAHALNKMDRCSLLLVKGRSQSFTGGRAQSGPLTALIGYLNVSIKLIKVLRFFFKFSLAGHNQHLGGSGPLLATPLQVVVIMK